MELNFDYEGIVNYVKNSFKSEKYGSIEGLDELLDNSVYYSKSIRFLRKFKDSPETVTTQAEMYAELVTSLCYEISPPPEALSKFETVKEDNLLLAFSRAIDITFSDIVKMAFLSASAEVGGKNSLLRIYIDDRSGYEGNRDTKRFIREFGDRLKFFFNDYKKTTVSSINNLMT